MVIPKVGGLFKRFSGAAPSNQKPPGPNRVQLGGKTWPVFDVKNINGRLLSDVPVRTKLGNHFCQVFAICNAQMGDTIVMELDIV